MLDSTTPHIDSSAFGGLVTLTGMVFDAAGRRFEERLSAAWLGGCQNDPAALRTTSAFHGIVQAAGANKKASIALIDLGPNLGAINRAAVLASDYIVVPLAPDPFSIQNLRNIGPTIRAWRNEWKSVRDSAPTDFPLPDGIMQPAGYVVLQQAVRLDRPVHGYGRWLQRIPEVYRNDVLDDAQGNLLDQTHCLATLRNYWSLMPMAEEARKPMFDLAPAYGALGSHAHLVRTCEGEFRAPAARLLEVCSIPSSS